MYVLNFYVILIKSTKYGVVLLVSQYKQHIINNEYYKVLHITFEIHSCWDVNYVTVACLIYKFCFQFYIPIISSISLIYRPKLFH